MLDLYNKVQGHDERMRILTELVDELKGLSMWEIQRMIERKKEEMVSSIEENNQYVQAVREEMSKLVFKIDHLSLEESKARQAIQTTILNHVSTV